MLQITLRELYPGRMELIVSRSHSIDLIPNPLLIRLRTACRGYVDGCSTIDGNGNLEGELGLLYLPITSNISANGPTWSSRRMRGVNRDCIESLCTSLLVGWFDPLNISQDLRFNENGIEAYSIYIGRYSSKSLREKKKGIRSEIRMGYRNRKQSAYLIEPFRYGREHCVVVRVDVITPIPNLPKRRCSLCIGCNINIFSQLSNR